MKQSKQKRRGPGRPYLGRTEIVTVTVTPEEYADLMIEAAKAGLRVPIYVRTVLRLNP